MKRSNRTFNIDFNTLEEVYYLQIRKNTKNKTKLRKFEDFYSINMCDALNKINDKDYKPKGYNVFLIKEPKYRIIMSQNIKDKLINHTVANALSDILEPTLIDTNVATRKNKGTSYGIKYVKKYLNEIKKGKTIYALKFDVEKYFYNINHDILKKQLIRKIKDKQLLNILFNIIDSTDEGVNDKIIYLKENEIKRADSKKTIEEIKRIPLYKKGKGLPIGNMTSQILAIYYLNGLDHFIKQDLKAKHYIRYMDDGVIISNDKDYLKDCLNKINNEIQKYDLKLNNKTKIINVTKEGLDFLGFRFYIIHGKLIMKIRNKTKKNFKRKMKLIKAGILSSNKQSVISSYQGLLNMGNCYKLIKRSLSSIFF